MAASELLNAQHDVTRNTVLKSVCAISRLVRLLVVAREYVLVRWCGLAAFLWAIVILICIETCFYHTLSCDMTHDNKHICVSIYS